MSDFLISKVDKENLLEQLYFEFGINKENIFLDENTYQLFFNQEGLTELCEIGVPRVSQILKELKED